MKSELNHKDRREPANEIMQEHNRCLNCGKKLGEDVNSFSLCPKCRDNSTIEIKEKSEIKLIFQLILFILLLVLAMSLESIFEFLYK